MHTALRPMSTSQVLDRTFHLYRNHFLLFCGIAALPPALLLIMQLGLMLFSQTRLGDQNTGILNFIYVAVTVVLGIFLFVVGYAIATGASVYAVSLVHLERPATIRESYQQIRSMLGRILWVVTLVFLCWIGIIMLAILILFALVLLFKVAVGRTAPEFSLAIGIGAFLLILGGFVAAFIVYARYSLAIPACVLENIPARQALRRSSALTKGSIGRIVLIYILTTIISVALSYLILSPVFIWLAIHAAAASAKGQQLTQMSIPVLLWNNIGEFLARTIAGPIATIAIALVYYDERIRKEAFDLHYMMQTIDGPQAQAATTSSAG
jgi:hypothetical protein